MTPLTLRWHRVQRRLGSAAVYVIAITVLAVVVVPLAFAVLGGFRSSDQLAAEPVSLPNPWVFSNYGDQFSGSMFWAQLFRSVLIAVLTTVLVVPAASMAAYVIARYRFPGRELLYTVFTLGLLFPVAVAILPLFVTLRGIHLLNNPLGVALPQAAFFLPLSIVVLRPFFQSIPVELADAAAIDGCGPYRFFWSVILPLSRPALSTVMILAVVTSWNAFLLPLLVLTRESQWTLPLGVNNLSSEFATDFASVLAYTTLAMVPALLAYLFAQRHIVSGLTAGAVKG